MPTATPAFPVQYEPPPVTEYNVGNALTTTIALPVITCVQVVVAFVATTVYVPAVVFVPKLIAAPVPATGLPVLTLFNCN